MKSLLGKLGVILIGLTIFSYAEAWGTDWKFYGWTGEDSQFQNIPILEDTLVSKDKAAYSHYYDRESLVYPTKGIARVWEKTIRLKEDRDVKEFVTLYEIHCSKREYRELKKYGYDRKREQIFLTHSPIFYHIKPGSFIEGLYKYVCK